jgi:DNA invertase Pin-like site-specific DNA recombinase
VERRARELFASGMSIPEIASTVRLSITRIRQILADDALSRTVLAVLLEGAVIILSDAAVAERLGLPVPRIAALRKSAGVDQTWAKRYYLTVRAKECIAELYRGGGGVSEIAKELALPEATIRRCLREAHLTQPRADAWCRA